MPDLNHASLTVLDAFKGTWTFDVAWEEPKTSPEGLGSSGDAHAWADGELDRLGFTRPSSIWTSNRDATIWRAYIEVKAP